MAQGVDDLRKSRNRLLTWAAAVVIEDYRPGADGVDDPGVDDARARQLVVGRIDIPIGQPLWRNLRTSG